MIETRGERERDVVYAFLAKRPGLPLTMSSQDPAARKECSVDQSQIVLEFFQVLLPFACNLCVGSTRALFAGGPEVVCVIVVLHRVHVLEDHSLDGRMQLCLNVRLKESLEVLLGGRTKERRSIRVFLFQVLCNGEAVG